jgi:hypothetical protein
MEKHVGSVRPVAQISDPIDHQNVRVGIGRERLLEVSSLASILEILDQFRRGGEERLEAVLDGAVPDGHRALVTHTASSDPIEVLEFFEDAFT